MTDDIVKRKGYLTLGSRLKRISDRLQMEVQDLMDQGGVPIQAFQYPLLASLDENGPMDIGSLAKTLGVSQPGVTRNVSQLSEQGIVRLTRGAKDRRQRIVALTDAGQEIVDHGRSTLWPQIETCLHEIISQQPSTLLDHLNHLETGLRSSSFVQRVDAKTGEHGDE